MSKGGKEFAMANKKKKKGFLGKIFSREEKKAFKSGMAYQYNKEHPKYGYAVSVKRTYFNEDGTPMTKPSWGRVNLYKTCEEAKNAVKNFNKERKYMNDYVLKCVKAKKVNIHDSEKSSIEYASCKKIKPTREIGRLDYNKL